MKQRLIDANALHYRMGVNQDDKQIFYVTDEAVEITLQRLEVLYENHK